MQKDDGINEGGSSDGACRLSEKVTSPNSSLPPLSHDASVIEPSGVVEGKHNHHEKDNSLSDPPLLGALLLAELSENKVDRRSFDEIKPIIDHMERLGISSDASFSSIWEMLTSSLGNIRNLSNDGEATHEEGDDMEDELRDSIHVTKQRWQSQQEQSKE